MPDLVGVVRFGGLRLSDREGFTALCKATSSARRSRVECVERPHLAIGVVRHHRRDPGGLAQGTETEPWVAWLGRPAGPGQSLEPRAMTEILARRGDRSLAVLQAPFAAVAGAGTDGNVWLVSDAHGLHPIYYAATDGALVFSSKFGALLASRIFRWGLDRAAVIDFFTYEHVTGDRTFADSVQVLSPAAVLRFGERGVSVRTYRTEVAPDSLGRDSTHDLADRLHEELVRSVTSATAGAETVIVTLSGGLDSRALLGCAVGLGANVRAFTFGTSASRDVRFARELARQAGVPHESVEIDGAYLLRWLDHGLHVTGGMISCLHYQILALADAIAGADDVVLDGLGGGELTGAHVTARMLATRSAPRAVKRVYRQRATGFRTADERAALFDADFLASTPHDPHDSVRRRVEEAGPPYWRACHRFYLLERQRRFIQYGPHQLRTLVDVATPFYALGIVSLMRSASASQLVGQRAYRLMQVQKFPHLAEIPDSRCGLPVSYPPVLRFAKRMFDAGRRRLPRPLRRRLAPVDSPVGYAQWLRGDLREFLEDHLLGMSPAFEGILSRPAVTRLVQEHLGGASDHTVKLGCALTFDSWWRGVRGS